jgi:lysozyme
MAQDPQQPKPAVVVTKSQLAGGGALVGIIGFAAASILTPFISSHESSGKVVTHAYHGAADPVGVWTICDGDTIGVKKGDVETTQGCAIRVDKRLAQFAKPVLQCTPSLYGHPNQLAAAISLAYNIGGPGYCGSTAAKRFNARQWAAACDAFLLWDKANGVVVQGLKNRRNDEKTLCMRSLPA